jgi:hypothetical protein
MSRIVRLPRAFPSRDGVPVIERVDTLIFTTRYFTHCLQCGFCHDWCCSHGVDVELPRVTAILDHAEGLEAFTGIGRERWFVPGVERDAGFPGGGARRTRVEDGACVFLRRAGRGCLIHAYCLDRGIDYHQLKSMVDCLFPVTFDDDLLCAADEVTDGELVCMDQGPSLFRGVEPELAYYFGTDCVAALAEVERSVLAGL